MSRVHGNNKEMATTTVHKFGNCPITCHAWNANAERLALSLNQKNVCIYRKESGPAGGVTWREEKTLDQHDLRVTGIDWAPKSNRIVTCSEDHNAYVWEQAKDGSWKYTLVVLRINRAATCVRWSPQENKFAIGSGAKIVNVCYYDDKYDWWVAKHIKKNIRSTVTTVDWHPNNNLLVAGATDFKVRVYSAFIKEMEDKPAPTVWGRKNTFGNLMAEFDSSELGGGWIHSVAFSLDGMKVAWVGHDSSLNVVDAENDMKVARMRTNRLPMLSVIWVSGDKLVGAGHNYVPILFKHNTAAGGLEEVGQLETEKKAVAGAFNNARKMFQNMDDLGISGSAGSAEVATIHRNQINELRVARVGAGEKVVTSCAGDGKLVIWHLDNIASKMGNLKI